MCNQNSIHHSDGDGKQIAAGSVVVRKEHTYSEFKEVKWNVNDTQFNFNSTSKLLKFELRRQPRNEVMEDCVISWIERNDSGQDVEKLPSFFNCVESIRVQINNKEVVDMKNGIYGIRQEWRDRLYTRYRTDEDRDAAWHWRTGNSALHTAGGLITPLVIPAGGGEVQCYASMSDLLGGVFDDLPMRRINLIEVEMTLANEVRFCGNRPEVLDVLHKDITVYSRHKMQTLTPPKPFSNHTIAHKEFEVLRFNAPSPLHTGGSGELRIDLHNLIPRRSNIERIMVFSQGGELNDIQAYQRLNCAFVGQLVLEKNGDFYLATDFFYKNRRQIAHQSHKYFDRHHGGARTFTGDTNNVNFSSNMAEFFIDTTMVTKTINATPLQDIKVKASEGIDNHDNLDLTIRCDGLNRLLLDATAVVLVEYTRYSRINPSGNIIHIATP